MRRLVRNAIGRYVYDWPNKEENRGLKVSTSKDFRADLKNKLVEEANEVVYANTSVAVMEKLANVYEVMRSLAKVYEVSMEDIITVAEAKRLIEGDFSSGWILEAETESSKRKARAYIFASDVLQAALLAEGNGVSLHDPDTRIFTRASKAFERYRFREGDRVLESGDIPADQRDFINRNLDMYQLKIGKYGILEKRD